VGKDLFEIALPAFGGLAMTGFLVRPFVIARSKATPQSHTIAGRTFLSLLAWV
jgi:hypothetical protein